MLLGQAFASESIGEVEAARICYVLLPSREIQRRRPGTAAVAP